MDIKNLEQLARIYNTLLLVNTKGEDTILMADCLKALKICIEDEQLKVKNSTVLKEGD